MLDKLHTPPVHTPPVHTAPVHTAPIRVGIVSTSWWADDAHIPAFQSHPQAEVVALCGRSRANAETMAAKYDIPNVFTDYRDMIRDGKLDAIDIAAPDDQHYEMTMAALDAGLHVLCEKPLALNADHAREMFEKAEANGVKHMVFLTWRWMPHHRYLQQLVSDGYIGECYQAFFRQWSPYGLEDGYGWRFDLERSNGIVSDLGTHMIDMARWCLTKHNGEITRVNAHTATHVTRPGPDGGPLAQPANDAAHIGLEFAKGAQGLIQVSSVAYMGEPWVVEQITLSGTEGMLETHLSLGGEDEGMWIRGVRQGEPLLKKLTIPDEYLAGFDPAHPFDVLVNHPVGPRHFVDAILHDLPVSPSFYDGWKTQEVVDAAIASASSACWMDVSDAA
ncbi:MAG: Gfo/Idh/MocA family oxidoreductase [Chloroflexota bacterium]